MQEVEGQEDVLKHLLSEIKSEARGISSAFDFLILSSLMSVWMGLHAG